MVWSRNNTRVSTLKIKYCEHGTEGMEETLRERFTQDVTGIKLLRIIQDINQVVLENVFFNY